VRQMTWCFRVLLVVGICVAVIAPTAQATPQIEFTIDLDLLAGSAVQFAGGAAPLTGTNIRISKITGIDTPLNSGVELDCSLCTLDFVTGAYLGDLLFVSGWSEVGSSLEITGRVNLDADAAFEIPFGSTLLAGAFESTVFDAHLGVFNFVAAMTSGSNHSLLNSFFGVASDFGPNSFTLNFTATGVLPDPISSTTIIGGRITNVPEPADLWLLAVAAGALFGIAYVSPRARALVRARTFFSVVGIIGGSLVLSCWLAAATLLF
jgi:hypothetical protein